MNELYPDGILAEFSEERITINPQGAWQISEMTTTPSPDGPRVSVADRPLGARPRLSGLLFPEALCAAAFEDRDDKMCVPRQIAQVLGANFDQVVDELDSVNSRCMARTPGGSEEPLPKWSSSMLVAIK